MPNELDTPIVPKPLGLNAGQSVDEERTETYTRYGEGVPQSTRKSSVKSSGRVSGSARKQAGAAKQLRRTILLLEDERWLAEAYAASLHAQNYTVYLANSAQSAVDTLDDHPEIELVLVDLLLPEHNGLTFLYEALSQVDWQERRFVLMSSLSPETVFDGESVLDELNVVDYIYKPAIKPFELGARIATVFV